MLDYGLPALMFVCGAVIIWQGISRVQGKRGARPDVATRLMMPSMSEEDRATALKAHQASNRAQGYMRAALGLFVIAVGIYLLLV